MEPYVGQRVRASEHIHKMFDKVKQGTEGTITGIRERGVTVKWDTLSGPMGMLWSEVEAI